MKKYLFLLLLLVCFVALAVPVPAFAEYTSLISSADFTAIASDVSTAVAGIISIALIILGASLLMRSFGR